MDTMHEKNRIVHLMRGDITELDIEAFVFYARHDLALGSGFGGAISMRGGPTIQEQVKEMGPLETTEVVVSDAGDLKANHIIHAVGPRFQEEKIEEKLRTTVINCLKAADEKGIKKIAFPPMGTGFYGIPLDVSARVMSEAIGEYLAGNTSVEKIVICLQDTREMTPFESYFGSPETVQEETS